MLPVWIGNAVAAGGRASQPWEFPLAGAGHVFISGKTGAGKSFAARVVCEGAVSHGNLAVLILDPRDQWVGLRRAEDRPAVLQRYRQFGLEPEQARSFDFAYHGVGRQLGGALPEDLGELAKGRHIVSFKGMDDAARCHLTADILDAVFGACARSESELPRVLIIVEEVPVSMKKGVAVEARDAAQRSEQSIDRVAREGRKYGLSLLLIGQSSKDMSYGMATVSTLYRHVSEGRYSGAVKRGKPLRFWRNRLVEEFMR
jgi:DNA helicase HerA-like ATPase